MHALIIIVLILSVLLVIFTLQNSFEITISVFFWEISNAPFVLVLLGCVVLGYIIAAIYFYPNSWKIKSDYKKALKTIKKLENKLESYGEADNPDKTGPEGIELNVDPDEKDQSFFRE